MFHWLLHVTGGDNGSGPFYLELSGFIGLLGFSTAIYAYLKRHNCHVHHCWRLSIHPVEGTPYIVCKKHHPATPRGKITVEHVHEAHKAHKRSKNAKSN